MEKQFRSTDQQRSHSVDVLRGLVMVILALDHVRDFFGSSESNPNIAQASLALFFTRWITHLCAPTFFFLAGTGAYLSLPKLGLPKVRAFLLKRGLMLMLFEMTIINWAWRFSFAYHSLTMAVIFALGLCMVLLSLAICLPVRWVGGIGVVIVVLHNLLDSVHAADMGNFRVLGMLLHEKGVLWSDPEHSVKVLYPLVPWIGVMMMGYAFGALWQNTRTQRARLALRAGCTLLGLFFALRCLNIYGDPTPWVAGETLRFTLQSFFNLQKYPPSLDFCLVTLGLSLLLLAAFERNVPRLLKPLNVYGRVPMLYYIAHLYLIHALALLWIIIQYGPVKSGDVFLDGPDAWGHPLPVVYGVWIFVVLALYPFCRWYARFKAHSTNPWLRYL
jgi:uncharacterized membrane protein